MYWDYQNEFSSEQSVTADAFSTNVLDIGKNAGAGEVLRVHAFVDGEAFTAAYGTLAIELYAFPTAALTGASVPLWALTPVAQASMVDGYVFNCPPVPAEHGRFLRLLYNVGATTLTAGKISACLARDRQTNKEQMGQA